MNHSQALDLINEIEASTHVNEIEYCDIPIWPILRDHLGFELIKREVIESALPSTGSPETPLVDSLKGLLKASLSDGKTKTWISGPKDVLFMGDQLSRIQLENSYYDRICDPISDAYMDNGYSTIHFEPFHSFRYFPRYRPSYLISNIIFDIAFKTFGLKILKREPSDLLKKLPSVLQIIDEKIGAKPEFSVKSIISTARQCYKYAAVWERVLSIIQPKIVYIVQYYNMFGWALCIACRRLGIPSIELPHGRQDPSHHAYGRWSPPQSNGYGNLPKVFWNWSHFEADTINAWNHCIDGNQHQSFIGGNPFLNLWKKPEPNFFPEIRAQLERKFLVHPRPPNILATLDFCTYGVKPVIELIKASPPEWQWFLRMHPTELHREQELIEILQRESLPDVQVAFPTKTPLYGLLSEVDLLCSGFSTVILEAKSMGVPSVSFSNHALDIFSEEIRSGWLRVSEDTETCLTNIKAYLSGSLTPKADSESNEPLPQTLNRLHAQVAVNLPLE